MKKLVLFAGFVGLISGLSSCYRCYTCTVETNFGTAEKPVCGREREIGGLIRELENDTTGYGPWTCERD